MKKTLLTLALVIVNLYSIAQVNTGEYILKTVKENIYKSELGKTKKEIKNKMALDISYEQTCEGTFDDTHQDYIGICLSNVGAIDLCYMFSNGKCVSFSGQVPSKNVSILIANLNNNKSLVLRNKIWYNDSEHYMWEIKNIAGQRVSVTCKKIK